MGFIQLGSLSPTPLVVHVRISCLGKPCANNLIDSGHCGAQITCVTYLPTFMGSNSKGKLKEGSVVLVREDGCPRLQWPMGVVIKTYMYPGKDGIIRAVDLKTASGIIKRPIQRLHNLEFVREENENSFSEAPRTNEVQDQYVTRAGRVIKPRMK